MLFNIGSESWASGTQARVAPGVDGVWGASLSVSDGTMVGDLTAEAACVRSNDQRVMFTYAAIPVHVTTYRRVLVEPTVVRPGAMLTLMAEGPCPYPNLDQVDVTLGSKTQRVWLEPIVADATEELVIDADGGWSGTMLVPPNTPPGDYVLRASCGYSRAITAWYEMTPVTVSND